MIFKFKSTTALWCILILLDFTMCTKILFIPATNNYGKFYLDILYILTFNVFGIVIHIVTEVLSRKIHKRYKLYYLFEDCDVEKFVEKYEPLAIKDKNQSKRQIFLPYYALGCSAKGDIEKAIRISEEILYFKSKRKTYENVVNCDKCTASINLSVFYMHNNELEKARDMLNKSRNLLTQCRDLFQIRIQPSLYYRWINRMCDAEYLLMFFDGNYRESLNYFLIAVNIPDSRYMELNYHYILSKIYEKLGDIEQQTKELKIVAEGGNTLQIAKDARIILEELQP